MKALLTYMNIHEGTSVLWGHYCDLVHVEMRYNKVNCFPSAWKILPSALGVGQYFPNFGETISNSDLNAGHYLYNNASVQYALSVVCVSLSFSSIGVARSQEVGGKVQGACPSRVQRQSPGGDLGVKPPEAEQHDINYAFRITLVHALPLLFLIYHHVSHPPPLCSHFSSDLHESQDRVQGRLGWQLPSFAPPPWRC